MGGQGSGQWLRWDSKSTTESKYALDIRFLKKMNFLRPGIVGTLTWSRKGKQVGAISFKTKSDYIILDYKFRERGNDWEDVKQTVTFDRTPCHYGGCRTWFLCPRCEKRVALLYLSSKFFLCRHCYDLTYTSQQENEVARLMSKAQKIRKKIGADPNLSIPILFKPKYMHQKTFDRLRMQADEANYQSMLIMGMRLGIF